MSFNSFDGAKVRRFFELTIDFCVFVIAHSLLLMYVNISSGLSKV